MFLLFYFTVLAEKPYEVVTEDLPPFPSLPGFPEENSTSTGKYVFC